MPNTASPTPPEEQQAEESRVKLLAECRDAFPIPEPSSPLEVQWAAAMARPEEVPEYVRLCVAAMQAAPKAAPGEQLTREQIREVFMAHGFTIKEGQTDLKQYVYDAAHALLELVAAPQQEAQEPAFVDVSLRTAIAKAVYQQVRVEFDYKLGSWTALDADEQQRIVDSIRGLYTAPQPAPAPLSDDVVKDAARYRWLRTNLAGIPEETDAAIDATIAAHGGK